MSAEIQPNQIFDSEQVRRAFFEQSPDAILLIDISDSSGEWPTIQCNNTSWRIYGYPGKKDFVRHSLRSLRSDGDELGEIVAGSSKNGSILKDEVHHRKDGTVFPVHCTYTLIDLKGTKYLMLVARDMEAASQLQAMATKIEEAEDRFQAIFENSPDGMVIINPTHHAKGPWLIEYCNRSFCEMNGFDRSELIGKDIRVVSDETATQVERPNNKYDRKIEDGSSSGETHRREYYKRLQKGPIRIEEIHKRKDGSAFPIQASSSLVTLGGQERVLGIDRDITQRKRAEEAQSKAEEKYRSIFENSIEGIFQTTPDGKFLSANPALAQILGYDSPRDLMTSITSLAQQLYVDPGSRSAFTGPLKDGGKISGFESEMYRKDGKTIWILANALAVRDGEGEPLYYEGSLVDITARKQIEQTNQESQRKQTVWISELQERTREMSLLNEMSDLVQACPTVEEAYSVISQQARLLFAEESGSLYVLGPSHSMAESVAAWGSPSDFLQTFKPADCWAFRRGQPHVVERDLAAGPRSAKPLLFCSHLQPPMPAASICVPLIAQGETLGLLHLRHDPDAVSSAGKSELWYTEARRELVHTVADSLALAISNLKLRDSLREQSIRDPLTGVFNRRYMEESLDRDIARVHRAGGALGVIMLDIDHFKHFNDMFGHECGDAVLRALGIFLRSQIREADIACRYGGEEFALIMPDASLEITCKRAEKIREEVKHLDVKWGKKSVGSVTLSLGVAEFPGDGSTGEVLIRIADAALYRAKKAGRDRVEIGKNQQEAAAIADPAK